MSTWTQQPSPQFERTFMQFHWRLRADWDPASWSLALDAIRVRLTREHRVRRDDISVSGLEGCAELFGV